MLLGPRTRVRDRGAGGSGGLAPTVRTRLWKQGRRLCVRELPAVSTPMTGPRVRGAAEGKVETGSKAAAVRARPPLRAPHCRLLLSDPTSLAGTPAFGALGHTCAVQRQRWPHWAEAQVTWRGHLQCCRRQRAVSLVTLATAGTKCQLQEGRGFVITVAPATVSPCLLTVLAGASDTVGQRQAGPPAPDRLLTHRPCQPNQTGVCATLPWGRVLRSRAQGSPAPSPVPSGIVPVTLLMGGKPLSRTGIQSE